MEVRTSSTTEWSRTYLFNPLPQINSHGLQVVDKNKQAASGSSAPVILILFVFHLRGLKPPGESELAIVFPGLKAGAIEEDNNLQLSLHRHSNTGLICLFNP